MLPTLNKRGYLKKENNVFNSTYSSRMKGLKDLLYKVSQEKVFFEVVI